MKLAELERHLRHQGCVLYREGGAHSIWFNPILHIKERGIDLLAPIWHFLDLTPQGAATGTPALNTARKFTLRLDNVA
jgi:predicted dithiol-disulfide oxidoreductase (DUF899 family)